MPSSSLHRQINALGAIAFAAYLVMAGLSWLQTPALWEKEYTPRADAFFDALYGAANTAAIQTLFGTKMTIIVSYWLPLGVATLALVALLGVLTVRTRQLDARAARLLMRWPLAFAAVSFFAFPVFTQDFWLSATWGRMVADGVNPYTTLFTPESLDGLPLDHFPMVMSYAPLWAILSAALTTLSFGSVWLAAFLFKGVLAAAWCGSLFLIDRIVRDTSPAARAMALAVFGWAPLSVQQSVAEGHNDIAMVFPAILWVALLLRRHWSGPFALAASVLVKYITAPLMIADALVNLRLHRMSLRSYVLRLILPGVAALAILAIFYRSPAFFDGLRLISAWHFLQPVDAVAALQHLLGVPLPFADAAVVALFPLIAAYQIYLFWKDPTAEGVLKVSLAIVTAVSLSAINHIWPWYIIWTLALAAMVPQWWLSQFILGLALLSPFSVAVWWIPELEAYKGLTAILLYAGASGWVAITIMARKALSARADAVTIIGPALPTAGWQDDGAPALAQSAAGK